MKRAGAQRAFVICGQTVSRKTGLVARIRGILGDACAGVFDELAKDTSPESVERAVAAARAVDADLLIAVGAGSVIQGTRIVAILLAGRIDPPNPTRIGVSGLHAARALTLSQVARTRNAGRT